MTKFEDRLAAWLNAAEADAVYRLDKLYQEGQRRQEVQAFWFLVKEPSFAGALTAGYPGGEIQWV